MRGCETDKTKSNDNALMTLHHLGDHHNLLRAAEIHCNVPQDRENCKRLSPLFGFSDVNRPFLPYCPTLTVESDVVEGSREVAEQK